MKHPRRSREAQDRDILFDRVYTEKSPKKPKKVPSWWGFQDVMKAAEKGEVG